MQILTKTIDLMDGTSLTVHEADGSYDAKVADQELKAERMESADKTLMFFARTYYPILYACTRAECPTLEKAYAMGDDLDLWYAAVLEVNVDLLKQLPEKKESRALAFRDDTQIQVHASRDLPSFMIRLHRLEQEAEDNPPADPNEISFRLIFYPKIAACSTGDVPSADQAVLFPRIELARWTTIVMEQNPQWFEVLQEKASALEKQKEIEKKREMKSEDSSHDSPRTSRNRRTRSRKN